MTVKELITKSTTFDFHHIENVYFYIPLYSDLGKMLRAKDVFTYEEFEKFMNGGSNYKIILPINKVKDYPLLYEAEIPGIGIYDSKTIAILPK